MQMIVITITLHDNKQHYSNKAQARGDGMPGVLKTELYNAEVIIFFSFWYSRCNIKINVRD